MKPTVDQIRSGQVEWPILDTLISNWEGTTDEDMQTIIDAIYDGYKMERPKYLSHTCRFCKATTNIFKGASHHCPGCLANNVVTCVEWL